LPAPVIATLRFYLGGGGTDPARRQDAAARRREEATARVCGRLGPLRVAYGPAIETTDLAELDADEAARLATDRLREAIEGLELLARGTSAEDA